MTVFYRDANALAEAFARDIGHDVDDRMRHLAARSIKRGGFTTEDVFSLWLCDETAEQKRLFAYADDMRNAMRDEGISHPAASDAANNCAGLLLDDPSLDVARVLMARLRLQQKLQDSTAWAWQWDQPDEIFERAARAAAKVPRP